MQQQGFMQMQHQQMVMMRGQQMMPVQQMMPGQQFPAQQPMYNTQMAPVGLLLFYSLCQVL
jgi:hypothetical protein